MKILRLSLLALGAATLLAPTTQAAPIISFYGYQIDQPRWRSTDYAKTITLAPDYLSTISPSPAYYGQSGWIQPQIVDSNYLPSYVAPAGVVAGLGVTAYSDVSYESDIDDGTEPITGSVAAFPAAYRTIAYSSPGEGIEVNLYNLTLSGTVPSSFLVGMAFGNLNPGAEAYGAASYRAGLNGGAGTGQLAASAMNSLIDWIFFKVDGAGAGDIINLYGTAGAAGMASVALVSFDPVPVPEPTTAGMLLLGGLGLAAMRRKRSA